MSGTPLARPDAWRLWWSFTWRQALVILAANAVMWAGFFGLKAAGLPPELLIKVHPYLNVAIIVYSGYEACRRLFFIYDIRLKGGHAGEQDHRHRR